MTTWSIRRRPRRSSGRSASSVDQSIGVAADVSKCADLQKLVEAAVERFGRLDIMVNNAGIETRTSVLDTSEAQYDKVMAVNLKSAFFGTQIAAKQMIKQGSGGRIINLTSVHEDWPMPGNTAYCLAAWRTCRSAIGWPANSAAILRRGDGIQISRSSEGHPLELLAFAPGATPAHWAFQSGNLCLGIDHSAISVADTDRSVAFYSRLGLARTASSLNVGPEQEKLDDLVGAVV